MLEAILKDEEIRNMVIASRHQDGRVFQRRISVAKFEASDGKYILLSPRNMDQEIATKNARLQAKKKFEKWRRR